MLDLLLDVYETQYMNDCFADLIAPFKREYVVHLLGFKLQFYQRPETIAAKLVAPRSLYRIAAVLLHKGLYTLQELYPHVSPTKAGIIEKDLQRVEGLKTAARGYGKVNLNAKKDDDAPAETTTISEEDANQMYGILVGLLEIGAYELALERIKDFVARDCNPLAYAPLARQLCVTISDLLASLYAPLSLASMRLVATAGRSLWCLSQFQSPTSRSSVVTADASCCCANHNAARDGGHCISDAPLAWTVFAP